jgi:hypothetical protein
MSVPENSENEFGFDSIRTSAKDRIRQIKPAVPPDTSVAIERIDAVADSVGFVSRDVASALPYTYQSSRAPKAVEPRNALNMRVPVSLGFAFQRFCDENRYSYPEGLAEIMRRAGLPTK